MAQGLAGGKAGAAGAIAPKRSGNNDDDDDDEETPMDDDDGNAFFAVPQPAPVVDAPAKSRTKSDAKAEDKTAPAQARRDVYDAKLPVAVDDADAAARSDDDDDDDDAKSSESKDESHTTSDASADSASGIDEAYVMSVCVGVSLTRSARVELTPNVATALISTCARWFVVLTALCLQCV
jgi:hypothetical protein